MSQKLEAFQAYLEKMRYYERACTLLSWDMYTKTPPRGYGEMADALTFFSTEAFVLSTSEELAGYLEALSSPEEFDQLNEPMQYTVRIMKRDFEKNKRIPKAFYEAFVSAQSSSMQAWETAKRSSDFSVFAPHLEKMISMTSEMCSYTDPGKDVYEVLLDRYEEGMDSASINRVFEDLKRELVPLVKKVLSAPEPDDSKFRKYFDPDKQKKLQDLLLRYIGFSMEAGTTGESEHPFTTGFSRNDVRVTNHYYEDDVLSSIFSAIHEGGHAIFQQNEREDLIGTAAADCHYMGIHESQSRFFENILGRNRNFWVPIYSDVQKLFPELQEISLDEFYREINHVRNSFIRTEADELTYALHIIIRYEIEQAIFRDHVPVGDLPELWNRKMQEYLQITPSNDAEGILQDMHWSDASFGYFPSYLLGNIYDGMFLEKMQEDLGPIDPILAAGGIQKITGWLNTNIHQYGNLRLPKEVIRNVCGKELSAEPLIHYFQKKYTELYNLQ